MNVEIHNIPFIRKDDGSGSYMNLYIRQSIKEKRIFINEEDFEKVKDLLAFFYKKKN